MFIYVNDSQPPANQKQSYQAIPFSDNINVISGQADLKP